MELNLLIVDDEVQIRRGMKFGIPWKKHGVGEVFTAEDPVEGLQILDQQHIHILITDIRIPGMTGLEFAEKAKEIRQGIRVILLSGYSEFAYAKKAIHIGVVEYLLKPVKIKELTGLVDAIRQELEQEERKHQAGKSQKQQERLEKHLLTGETGEDFCKFIREYTGAEAKEKIQCIVFALDTPYLHMICPEEEEVFHWLQAQKGGFTLKKNRLFIWFAILDLLHPRDQILISMRQEMGRENARRREKGLYTISAAAGRIGNLGELPQIAAKTEKLLDFRLFSGKGIWVDADESVEKRLHETIFLEESQELRRYVAGYQWDRAKAYIQNLFAKMAQDKVTSYNFVKGVCVNFMQVLVKTLCDLGARPEELLNRNQRALEEIPEYLQLAQYEQWILEQYQKLLDEPVGKERGGLSHMILMALVYIDGHYQEDITVDVISSKVQKSRNYFSTLFKQEMGMPFTEYLNRYRVEKAKKLLESSLYLNGEIAFKVGFRDEKYFSAVFKKIEGCSPTEYRRRKGDR